MSEFSQFKSTPSSSPIDVKDAAARWQLQSTQTATGNPLTLTDCAPINAESLVVELQPKQDLHGYQYPWVGGSHYNQWDEVWEVGNIDRQGQDESSDTTIRSKNYIPCQSDTEYRVLIKSLTTNNIVVYFYDTNTSLIPYTGQGAYNNGYNSSAGVFTTPNGTAYMRFRTTSVYGAVYNNDIAINYPSSITTYSPWQNICPITGYTQTSVEDVGKNLLNVSLSDFNNAETYGLSSFIYIPVKNGIYTVSSNAPTGYIWAGPALTEEYRRIYQDVSNTFEVTNGLVVFGILTTDKQTALSYNTQLELGSTATSYEPYASTSATIEFGQTVYGAEVDFSGGTSEKKGKYACDGTETVVATATANIYRISVGFMSAFFVVGATPMCSHYKGVPYSGAIANMNDGECCVYEGQYGRTIAFKDTSIASAEDFEAFLLAQHTAGKPVEISLPLITETKISTPPTPLKLLKGTNNLSADGVMQIGYQPDNVIGEVKGEIEAITEMDYLRILDNNVETPINNYRIYYHLIVGPYTLVNMAEMLQHRFIFVELIQNPSGTYNHNLLHSALIDTRSIDGFKYQMKATVNDNIWIESNLDENKFYLALGTTGGSYSDGDPTDYYVTIRMVD